MAEYIDRQAAIDAVKHAWHKGLYPVEYIEELPSAEPERKKGNWIWDDEGYHCSECWFHAHGNTLECMDGTYRFCPNCGADMRGET